MKNKFKKSKIIVPALALITATTAASVTGTVAWFTATRTVTATTNSFVSTDVDSNLTLECAIIDNSGITVSSDKQSVSIQGKLTHGSYNALADLTGNAYVANLGDDGVATDYRELGTVSSHTTTTPSESGGNTTTNNWLAKADTTTPANQIWYAVAWTMTFTYQSSQDGVTSYLLFDANASTMQNANNAGHTMPGFRIAFMNSTDSKLKVIGGDSTKTHVKSTTETDSFAEVTAIGASATTSNRLADNADKLADNSIGTFNDSHQVTLTCVAWFEGTDASVVNTYQKDTNVAAQVTSSLVFYSRNANA